MKVEQDFLHGEVETEEKAEGDLLHEQLLAMKPTTRERLIEGIENRKVYAASFPLAAEVGKLVLVGVPDAVIFQNSKPTFVLELKTTRRDATILYDGQRAQAAIYGLLLDQVGFECRDLRLIIVKFRRETPIAEREKARFLDAMITSLVSGSDLSRFASASNNQVVVHSLPYSREEARATVFKTEGYWLGERDPVAVNADVRGALHLNQNAPQDLVHGTDILEERPFLLR